MSGRSAGGNTRTNNNNNSSVYGSGGSRIPKVQLAFLLLAVAESILQIACSVWLLTMHEQDPESGTVEAAFFIAGKQREFACIVLFLCASITFFAGDAVYHGNVFEFRDTIAMSIILTSYVCYSFWISANANLFDIGTGVKVIWTIVTVAFQILYFVLVHFVERSFGFRAYKHVGANIEMQSIYRTCLICESILKLDLVVCFLLMLMAGLFLNTFSHVAIVNICGGVFTIVWSGLLYLAIRKENKWMTLGAFFSSWVQPAYVIFKLVDVNGNQGVYAASYYDHKSNHINGFAEFLAIGAMFVVGRGVLLFFAYKTYKNYNKGLRNKVFVRSASNNSDGIAYNPIPRDANDIDSP